MLGCAEEHDSDNWPRRELDAGGEVGVQKASVHGGL